MDLEVVLLRQRNRELGNRAGVEGDRRAAFRADQMVTVDGCSRDIHRASRGVENAREYAERRENLEGAVDRGAPRFAFTDDGFGHELLGGEGARLTQRGGDDRAPGRRHAIAMPGHRGNRLRWRIDLGC